MYQNFVVIFSLVLLVYFVNVNRAESRSGNLPNGPCKSTTNLTAMSFYYFAYGSNLLSQRIHINNPSAKRVDIGQLEGYRLDFTGYSDRWNGAIATVEPTKNRTTWGTIWELDMADKSNLDTQEGVELGIYEVLDHCITFKNGTSIMCRLYRHTSYPTEVPDMKNLPQNRRPSVSYIDVIRKGAKESDLPADYIEFLFTIPDNGNTTSIPNLTEITAQ